MSEKPSRSGGFGDAVPMSRGFDFPVAAGG